MQYRQKEVDAIKAEEAKTMPSVIVLKDRCEANNILCQTCDKLICKSGCVEMKHGWYLMKRDNYYMTALYDGAFYRYTDTGQYLVTDDFEPVKWLCEYDGKEQGE